MSSTFIARVFVSDSPIAPEDVMRAIDEVTSTASLHGGAWNYFKAPLARFASVGAIVCFNMGLASPYYGPGDSAERVARALRRSIRRAAGRGAQLEVEVLDAYLRDEIPWRKGLPTHLRIAGGTR